MSQALWKYFSASLGSRNSKEEKLILSNNFYYNLFIINYKVIGDYWRQPRRKKDLLEVGIVLNSTKMYCIQCSGYKGLRIREQKVENSARNPQMQEGAGEKQNWVKHLSVLAKQEHCL